MDKQQKRALKAALNKDWKKAIEINKAILEENKEDVAAKMRLGVAYLNTKKYKEAEKLFKEVLKKQPVNKIAKKNLELAENKKQPKTNGMDKKQLVTAPTRKQEVKPYMKIDSLEDDEED